MELESKAWTNSNQNALNEFKCIGAKLDRQCLHFWGRLNLFHRTKLQDMIHLEPTFHLT